MTVANPAITLVHSFLDTRQHKLRSADLEFARRDVRTGGLYAKTALVWDLNIPSECREELQHQSDREKRVSEGSLRCLGNWDKNRSGHAISWDSRRECLNRPKRLEKMPEPEFGIFRGEPERESVWVEGASSLLSSSGAHGTDRGRSAWPLFSILGRSWCGGKNPDFSHAGTPINLLELRRIILSFLLWCVARHTRPFVAASERRIAFSCP